VPISANQALYYILPIGGDLASVPANFRLVSYTADIIIPDSWVLVAINNGNTNTLIIAGGKYTLHKNGAINTGKYSSAFVPNADLVRGLPADFTSSKAVNGYQKLPSGVIIQWGSYGVNNSTPNSSAITINYPISFPSSCFTVVVGSRTTATVNNLDAIYFGQPASWTASGFTTQAYYLSGMTWLAIGN